MKTWFGVGGFLLQRSLCPPGKDKSRGLLQLKPAIKAEQKKMGKSSLLIKSLTVVFLWIHKSKLKAVLLVEKGWMV